jgi:hypothetical protein
MSCDNAAVTVLSVDVVGRLGSASPSPPRLLRLAQRRSCSCPRRAISGSRRALGSASPVAGLAEIGAKQRLEVLANASIALRRVHQRKIYSLSSDFPLAVVPVF